MLGVLQAISVRHHDDLNDRRRAAVAGGVRRGEPAADPVEVDVRRQVLHRLLDGATADFHDQLEKQAKAFQQAIAKGKVVSAGSIAVGRPGRA